MLETEVHQYYFPELRTLHRLVTGQQYEPKAPWVQPRTFEDLNAPPLEADVYKSVKTMARTNYGANENFIPLTEDIKEGMDTVVGFLDQLLSTKSIPLVDISDLLAEVKILMYKTKNYENNFRFFPISWNFRCFN